MDRTAGLLSEGHIQARDKAQSLRQGTASGLLAHLVPQPELALQQRTTAFQTIEPYWTCADALDRAVGSSDLSSWLEARKDQNVDRRKLTL
jgi:hypothetical protein